jgi:cytochrome c biogenesis protein CcdA
MGSPSNLSLMNRFAEKYGVSYPSYPVIFAGDTVVLQGFNRISKNIDSVAKAVDAGLIPDVGYEKRLFSSADATGGIIGIQDLTYPAVILAGLLDGINPCAFAVLIFLLIALTAAESKRRVLQIGLTYTLGVFLIYITAGIGIVKIVSLTGLSFYFTVIAGILVIAAGIIEVADGILKNSPVSLSIPESRKELFVGYIRRATVPAAFVLGILVGIFELPCTGGIYLAVLSLLSSQVTFNEGLIYLVIYNLAFVLPLILIVLAVTLGISPEMINRFREEHKRRLRIAIGILLIAMGIFVIVLSYI